MLWLRRWERKWLGRHFSGPLADPFVLFPPQNAPITLPTNERRNEGTNGECNAIMWTNFRQAFKVVIIIILQLFRDLLRDLHALPAPAGLQALVPFAAWYQPKDSSPSLDKKRTASAWTFQKICARHTHSGDSSIRIQNFHNGSCEFGVCKLNVATCARQRNCPNPHKCSE